MARFYVWSNNGVVAVMPEAVFREMEHRRRVEQEAWEQGRKLCLPLPRPVFTFADTGNPGLEEWLTGTIADMRVLLEGHEVVRDRNFYVPFSNGYQWGWGELAEVERRFRTTLRQAIDAFDLVPRDSIETHGFDRTVRT